MSDTVPAPIARIHDAGIRAVDLRDLLAVAISPNAEMCAASEIIAQALVRRYKPEQLRNLTWTDLSERLELDQFGAMRILAAIEIGRRSEIAAKGTVDSIRNPDDVAKLFEYLKDEASEHFCIALLNTKKGVIATRTIHKGTVNRSVVGPREIFREAVREGAASIILVHNHPSGDPEPSPEDRHVTVHLVAAGEMMEIPVDDHVVIGHHGYVSFLQRGWI